MYEFQNAHMTSQFQEMMLSLVKVDWKQFQCWLKSDVIREKKEEKTTGAMRKKGGQETKKSWRHT